MKIRVFPLEFRQEGSTFFPKDPDLHKLAVDYAEKNLAKKVVFTDFRNVWAACEVGEEQKPQKVCGLMGLVLKPDFALMKFDHAKAALGLITRSRSFLQDNFSASGSEAFIFISSKDEESQMCPKWKEWLDSVDATPADRWSVRI